MEPQKMQNIVSLSDNAKEELKKLIVKEADNPDGVRLSLLAGGCSGLSYNLQFDKVQNSDIVDEQDGIKVIIDPKSALYLSGIILDYQGGLTGRGFVFQNPNATRTCGCGSSFSSEAK